MSRRFFASLCLLLAIGFAALGVWQAERRAWKLDLIARVDARVHAPAQALPDPASWARINEHDDAYRHVRAQGVFLNDRETLVKAVTEAGPGWWVITPLRTASAILLVNRGFVPPERAASATRSAGLPTGQVTVTGLLRLTEPKGAFLQNNDAVHGRWFSRDVAAIAKAQGLNQTAPFFIDADARPNAGGYPVGGLTVTTLRNAHLAYALTWFGLAALSLAGSVIVFRAQDPR
ncbi:MAG: SURF1 family protein [Pseudomonadota bacterium]|nr:SURF1 family protein [Pseudomonadota bacterium]